MVKRNPEENSETWHQLQIHFLSYLKGDAKATQALFIEIGSILKPYFHARARSSSVAEDLTQASLLKIHFARERFNGDLGSLKTWVFTIANRCWIDHWRNSKGDESLFSDSEEEQSILEQIPSPEINLGLRFEFNKDLNQALDLLKPNDRWIVYLYAVEDFSMAEIAKIVGLSEAAVKIRAHRSYVQLRKILAVTSVVIFILWRG